MKPACAPSGVLGRLARWPVFMCGFRPFFVLTAVSAVVLMLAWLSILGGALPTPFPGGSLAWHGHELIYGFGVAAIAGFALTAVPEFTHAPHIGRQALLQLTLLWLAARLAYALAGLWPSGLGLWPAAALNLAVWLLLLRSIVPAVWRDAQRRHRSFAWILAAMALLEQGFFVAIAFQGDALAWLRLTVGLMMMLIVVSASRVSMVVVNGLMEQGRPGEPPAGDVGYLARPPRRNLAIFCMGVCSVIEFMLGQDRVTGWTALAAAAAMLNLLNDWHVGRPLFTRWALMMYATYWLMALGYGLMGAAWLGAALPSSAGRHALMAGAMALSIFTIMAMAGRIHAGLWLDRRPWLPLVACALVLAAGLRVTAGATPYGAVLLFVSGGVWAACFAVYGVMAWRVLTGPRSDDGEGCAEPVKEGDPA